MSKTCSVRACDGKHYGKTYCQMHYRRWKKSGHPGPAKRKPHNYIEGNTGYIQLHNGKYTMCDKKDFKMLTQYMWHYVGGYAGAWVNKKKIRMHTILIGDRVDHINRDPLDNRRKNLRVATHQQNMWNAGPKKGRYKGVFWNRDRRKWQSRLVHNYKQHHVGMFNSEDEAAKAYDKLAKKMYGEFAYLNFPNHASK